MPAVDAGHGQLVGSLRQDPRVVNLERVNVGAVDRTLVPEPVEVVTIDVSYLSLAAAVTQLEPLALAPDAELVGLVKPMFELGLATAPASAAEIAAAVALAERGLRIADWEVRRDRVARPGRARGRRVARTRPAPGAEGVKGAMRGTSVRSMRGPLTRLMAPVLLTLAAAGCDDAPNALSPAGEDARRIADLTWVLVGVLSAIYLGVIGLFLVIAFRGRRRREGAAGPLGSSSLIVGGGIAMPLVVLLALMAFTSHTTQSVAAEGEGEPDVLVIAHQFWWEVRYPDADVVTANEIHIPVGRTTRVALESPDVIHSFWVPELHGKKDAVPGETTYLELRPTRTGTYRGLCAEYCGIQHANMQLLVVVEEEGDHEAWLAGQAEPAGPPADERGAEVFLDVGCGACHAIAGTPAAGRIGPDLTHLAVRRTLAAGILPNTRGHLAGWILDPQSAKPGNRMPPTTLGSTDLQRLLDYLEGLE